LAVVVVVVVAADVVDLMMVEVFQLLTDNYLMLNPASAPAKGVGTVITRELIVPITENVSCLAMGIDTDAFIAANALL
jgi:hypothetical protein